MFKKIVSVIVIISFTTFYVLALANTQNAFAFVVPSISGVVNAAGAMADAGESLASAGKIIGMAIPATGPFGLSTSVAQWLQGKSSSMLEAGKMMTSAAKLQVELSKVQASVDAADNAVTDIYSADADITGARNTILSNGLTMNDCQGGQGILGSIASEQCTENTINSNISDLQGTYTDLGGQAGISGNGISSALAGSSSSQAALLSGAGNFQYISENGLAGSVSVSPQSNLCQDEIAAGMAANASQCTESYRRALNDQLNKNLLVDSTEGIAAGNSEIATGSGFSKNASNMTGTYDQQMLDLSKMTAEENAQQLKAMGELNKQMAISNQTKAAKTINNSKVPGVSKLPPPPTQFIY